MRSLLAVALLSLAVCACGGGDPRRGGRDGGPGATDAGPRPDGARPPVGDGGAGDDCASGARWIYLVDSGRALLRFEPDTLTLTPIGTLDCPASLGASPFSMSVDRNATAWVLYGSGELFRVSTADASCSATTFAPHQAGFEVFGMGFVSDAEGSADETLFVAGGAMLDISLGSARLATIDMGTLGLSPRSDTLPGWPELTGTGRGELWGYFPEAPPTVRRLDKTNGATLQTFDLPGVEGVGVSAWAFAFWGGRFYVFLEALTDFSTNVFRLDPSDGRVERVIDDSGYRIVGAGVSTCAPIELI